MSSNYNIWASSNTLNVALFPGWRWQGFFHMAFLCSAWGSQDGGERIRYPPLVLNISIALSWASGTSHSCSECAKANASIWKGRWLQLFDLCPCSGCLSWSRIWPPAFLSELSAEETLRSFLFHSATRWTAGCGEETVLAKETAVPQHKAFDQRWFISWWQRGLQCKQAPVAHTRQLPCTSGTQSAHQTPTACIRHPLCIPGTLWSLFCGITLPNIFAQSHAHQEAERSTVKSKWTGALSPLYVLGCLDLAVHVSTPSLWWSHPTPEPPSLALPTDHKGHIGHSPAEWPTPLAANRKGCSIPGRIPSRNVTRMSQERAKQLCSTMKNNTVPSVPWRRELMVNSASGTGQEAQSGPAFSNSSCVSDWLSGCNPAGASYGLKRGTLCSACTQHWLSDHRSCRLLLQKSAGEGCVLPVSTAPAWGTVLISQGSSPWKDHSGFASSVSETGLTIPVLRKGGKWRQVHRGVRELDLPLLPLILFLQHQLSSR